MTKACNEFQNWCNLNKLILNLSEYKAMVLSSVNGTKPKEMKNDIFVEIGNYRLEIEFKNLGVNIDENLRFNSHI